MGKDRSNLISGEDVHREDIKALGPSLAKRLKNLRTTQGTTLKDISQGLDLSLERLSELESGTSFVSVGEAKKLADFYGVTPEYIITGQR